MLSIVSPFAPPAASEPLELGEVELAVWTDVYLTGTSAGVQLGKLTLTNRYLRFNCRGGLGSWVLAGLRSPPIGSVLPNPQARSERIALTDIREAKLEKQLRVFHKLRLSLKGGRELVLNFGVRSPTALLEELGTKH